MLVLRRKQLIKDDEEEQERKQFHLRFRWFVLILTAFLLAFFYLLFDTQIVKGADYAEQSSRKIAQVETVEAARGNILDRYGRTLVTNQLSYNVSLNTSYMGTVSEQCQILLSLMEICTEQSVTWTDTLPLSKEAPYTITLDSVSETAQTRFTTLAEKMDWSTEDGTELLAQMRSDLKLDESLSDEDARNVVGVLYELLLRTKNITATSYVFAEDVDVDFIAIVKERGLLGVSIDTSAVRSYNTSFAAHILGRISLISSDEWPEYQALGYTMDATVGKDGVEKAFETYLHGVNGSRTIETNTSGKEVSEEWITEPEPGDNVVLTIDIQLQEMVERTLAEYVPTLENAEGAACVIMDVNSGAVLAMASYPTYDLSQFSQTYSTLSEDPLRPLYNRATMGLYAPGSTFKMAVAIGALEEGIITPDYQYYDSGIYSYYPSNPVTCWIYRQYGGHHGWENVTGAIRDSCNVFFYEVGRLLTIQKIDEYAAKFGLGEPTGIELPEKVGVVAGPEYSESIGETWTNGMTLSAAIGQQNSQFTPLQLTNYIATLVNGGKHYTAHLLQSVKSNDFSQTIYNYEPEVTDVIDIDETSLNAVKEGMLEVTQSGSLSSYFKNLGVEVGAKTGSAQVSANSDANALIVAFAPYDNPEIAMCIVVEKGASGSALGGVAADIISYYFNSESSLESADSENSLLP